MPFQARLLLSASLVFLTLDLTLLGLELFAFTNPSPIEIEQTAKAMNVPTQATHMRTITQLLDRSGLGLTTYSFKGNGEVCLMLHVYIKRPFTGVGAVQGAGRCQRPSIPLKPVTLFGLRHPEGYTVAGSVNDEEIVGLRAEWLDGSRSLIPISQKTFLYTRLDGTGLRYVEGLDKNGVAVSGSLTYDEASLQSVNGVTQEFDIEGGTLVVTTYSLQTKTLRHCLQVSYKTFENLARAISGQAYLADGAACVESQGPVRGPSIGTTVGDSKVLIGQILNQNAARVRVRWSDGTQQERELSNGVYVFQRPLTLSGDPAITITDKAGNVLEP
jgi:hypothetical protein